MTFIYELLCPKSGQTRYIGKANNPEVRYRKHLQAANHPENYAQRWIASLLRDGLKPVLRVAMQVGNENWQTVERECIALGMRLGFPLTNTSAGGEGAAILDPAIEAARIEKTKKAWKNQELRDRHSAILREVQNRPAVKEANRQRMAARWADPSYAAECSRLVREAYATPEARAAQSERSKAAHRDPVTKAKRSAAQSAAWNRDGAREKRIDALKDGCAKPEVKARRAELMKLRHADPEYKAKVSSALSDPEMIERRNLAISAGHQRRQAALREAREAQK